jgi:hypothetical protein
MRRIRKVCQPYICFFFPVESVAGYGGAGRQTLRVVIDNGWFNLNYLEITPALKFSASKSKPVN